MNLEPVIGLEVHVQLKTVSKLFCSCSTAFGASPNSHVCPVCLGLPGALPVLNQQALDLAIQTGLMLKCEVSLNSKFDRKNYFYPDLPKAYQISQYDLPLCDGGIIEFVLEGHTKEIHLERIHMEEDAGKLIHFKKNSGVDYNRGGIPLIEIVSRPEIYSPQEAFEYLKSLKRTLEYLDVSDCNMEEGSLRCDANISLREKGSQELGVRTEIKNLNSFRAVEKSITYEINRQEKVLLGGGKITQETLLWDADHESTKSMRSKEQAHDYRYFPEPDLLPILISQDELNQIKNKLTESPLTRENRFKEDFGLPAYDAGVLTAKRNIADFFEETAGVVKNYKAISNWIMADLMRELNQADLDISDSPVKPQSLAKLINIIDQGKISGKMAKDVFVDMFMSSGDPEEIVQKKGFALISDEGSLSKIVDKVINGNSKSVKDFKNGKKNAIGFLVGQVMRETKGQADPKTVNQLLAQRLTSV